MRKEKPEYEKAILSAKKEFVRIAGKEAWDRESKIVLSILNGDLSFRFLDGESVKSTMLNLAYTGTTLSNLFREAYLNARDGKLSLDFTYRGLIKIATSDGKIISMNAGVVYQWDKFSHRQGTHSFINHEICMDPPKDTDEVSHNVKLFWESVMCAYAVATFPNGVQEHVILPRFKLLKTWKNTALTAINEAYPDEWARKTSIRYLAKTLPLSHRLVTAVSVMNEQEGSKKKEKPKSRLMGRLKK